MQKQIGAILLVAGTCIGSGMIALPMVLATLGLIPSIALMVLIWALMYYTSLINLELNLQAGRGMPLGSLGRAISGKGAEAIGVTSLKLLSYALLAVFIYGGSSILQQMLYVEVDGKEHAFATIETIYALIALGALLLPLKIIDYLNRILFIALLVVVLILVTGMASAIDWKALPLFSEHYSNITLWSAAVPVVFTSFGFQVIFHTLADYCRMDDKMLKRAFFWGSLIPLLVYMLWTSSVLSVVHHESPAFYQQMVAGKAEVGRLIQELSSIAKWQSVQLLVWWISLLAIATSVLGVGVGLCDTIYRMLRKKIDNLAACKVLSATLTILPAYLVAVLVPNAFIAALGFAGMILAIIAILLPVYLFQKSKIIKLHYPELKANWAIALSTIAGAFVILFELYNMF
ncbi:MAG: amino acid permease [Parachlamydiaceae bacterium]|nr:amino acid permease [Parachlamydiaceae bacterium]